MSFKPGDIVVWKVKNKVVLLVLEVDSEKESIKGFVLDHYVKNNISRKEWYYQDMLDNLKEIKL